MKRGLQLIIRATMMSYLLLAPSTAEAHRSGCHRWHSCPSDSGSYVCGDTGYDTYCGNTHVPPTTSETKIQPAPTYTSPRTNSTPQVNSYSTQKTSPKTNTATVAPKTIQSDDTNWWYIIVPLGIVWWIYSLFKRD